jgi:DNA-binding transcriptional ArsR family regulator
MLSTRRKRKDLLEDRLDAVFHALADRTRRRLLARLKEGPAMVTELAAPIAMALPSVSKHIRVLEAAKLVTRSVDGRVHRCSFAPTPLQDIERWLEHYRPFWNQTLEALAEYVEDSPTR